MIERYFKAGVRFLWNKPNDSMGPTNGAIVASAGVPTNLTYDGLDGHREVLDPHLGLVHASTVLGLRMGGTVNYAWLDYAPGRTARKATGAHDILTGYMSGCLIIRGTHGGAMNVFHVGTIDGAAAVNKRVKSTFARSLPQDATGFNPLGAWPQGEISALQNKLGGAAQASSRVFGVVTTAGAFYALLLFNVAENGLWQNPQGQRRWCVGGLKPVPSMTRALLMARLMS